MTLLLTTAAARAVVLGLAAGALCVVPSTAAQAGPVLCQGQVATIVGVGTETVTGTEGDDVIVGAGTIEALGGDDTICAGGPWVYAGEGDDSVTTDGSVPEHVVWLGPGDDRFVGGPTRDVVGLDLPRKWVLQEWIDYNDPDTADRALDDYQGDDVISTGAGDDEVFVGSWESPQQGDRVDLGPGDDVVRVAGAGMDAGAAIDGGPGRDQVEFRLATLGPHVLDLPRRTLTVAGRLAAPTGSAVEVHGVRAGRVDVVGTAGPDTVHLDAGGGDVSMRAGDDVVRYSRSLPRGRLDAGAGRDRLEVVNTEVRVDLARGRASSLLRPGVLLLRLQSVADVTTSKRAMIVGDARANRITLHCGRVRAGGGADVVRQAGARGAWLDLLGELSSAPASCRGLVVHGGPGRDRIVGSLGDDDLSGGPGRDRVDGRAGRDRCVAERRVRCER
ncbi:hypothetical protein ABFT23_04430 [Nocardioides sp. C4-1]|uniref:hypothetical protein n=1 Tax=Nocardioides sp. C4-1 TaxID=3151851 RepID=UPI0032666943